WKQNPEKFCRIFVDGLMKCVLNENTAQAMTFDKTKQEQLIQACVQSTKKKMDEWTVKVANCMYEAGADCEKVKQCIQIKRPSRNMRKNSIERGPAPTNNLHSMHLSGPLPPMDNRCTAWAGTLASCKGIRGNAYSTLLKKLCIGTGKLPPQVLAFLEPCMKKAGGSCIQLQRCEKRAAVALELLQRKSKK
ncbi:hypothetical protein KKF84_00715, partial [Myxococcota bacterium]|nr:hypothetical protein [Myxococcota bacterium]MBU1533806.1 hypothetical protein [Myxococcota bacterium]